MGVTFNLIRRKGRRVLVATSGAIGLSVACTGCGVTTNGIFLPPPDASTADGNTNPPDAFIAGVAPFDAGHDDAFVNGIVVNPDASPQDSEPHDGLINGILVNPDASPNDGAPGPEIFGVIIPPADGGGDAGPHGVVPNDVG
jgi:hypothetical protein